MFELVTLMLLSQMPLERVVQGQASYYTVTSSSTRTASGDTLNDATYTCAMRDGEFGTFYLVEASNGKSVICRLNDRGPFVKERVIDLSVAAMRKLSPDRDTIRVKVFKIGSDRILGFVGLN